MLANIEALEGEDANKKAAMQLWFSLSLMPTRNDEARAAVLAKIAEGKLTGLAYALPRQPNDMPIIVPTDLWGGRVSWRASTLKRNGL